MSSQSVGNLYVRLSANNTELVRGLNQAGSLIQQFNKQTINIRDTPDPGGGLIGAAAGIGALYAGLSTVKAFAEQGYRAQVEYTETARALEAMTGSAEEAQKLLGQSRDFAMDSPFDPGQVSQFTRQLLGAGVASNQVIPTIKALADVSAGIGGDLGLVSRAYTQVMAKGRLYAEELNGQFADQGLGAKAFADALHLPQDQFLKMVKDGEVSAGMVTQAFANMTAEGGKFFDLSKKLADADPIAQMNKRLEETARLLTDATLKAVGFDDGMKGLNGHLGRVNKALETGEFWIKAGQMRNDAVQPIGEALIGLQAFYTFSKKGRDELKRQLDEFRGGLRSENEAAERALHAIWDQQKTKQGIGALVPPAPVFVLPPLVKEYIDHMRQFQPASFMKLDGRNIDPAVKDVDQRLFEKLSKPLFERFENEGRGLYSMFRQQVEIAKQGIEAGKIFGMGGGVPVDVANREIGEAFLKLEAGLNQQPQRPSLVEIGTQAAYDLVDRIERENRQAADPNERVRQVLEQLKATEERSEKLLQAIADAAKRQPLRPVKLP